LQVISSLALDRIACAPRLCLRALEAERILGERAAGENHHGYDETLRFKCNFMHKPHPVLPDFRPHIVIDLLARPIGLAPKRVIDAPKSACKIPKFAPKSNLLMDLGNPTMYQV
jgi:hypothetical protein